MEENKEIKSLNHDIQSYVTFYNRTIRKVAIMWHDYEGKLVRYAIILPGAVHHMHTYVTHPWSAVDSDTGDRLLIDKNFVFYPRTQNQEDEVNVDFETINIDVPVYPLLIRCLQIVKKIVPLDHVDELQLPERLKRGIKHAQSIDFKDYGNFVIVKRKTNR